VNGLARDGRLQDEELAWLRENNARYDASYTDPSTINPLVYDRTVNPGATSWFRADAVHLTDRIGGYLDLLDKYKIEYERVESSNPGRVLYEDEVQIVVVP
jgi:hypothetical protein